MTRSTCQWRLRSGRSSAPTLFLVLVLALMPVASAEVTPDDPVVADVVRMLDAGVEPRLIRSWLDSSGKRPGVLSANDMIALSAANAPDELIELLLTQSATPVTSGALQPDQPSREPPSQADGTVQPNEAARAPATSALPTGTSPPDHDEDCCLIRFAIEYRAAEDTEGEAFEQAGRDLFLYIDGKFLARLESQGDLATRGPERFETIVAPGEHTVRLMRELHTQKRWGKDDNSWAHETTVSPSRIQFQVAPGAQWQLEMTWTQSEFSTQQPLSWRWSRNGQTESGEQKTGAFRENWPYLCEDAIISGDSGAIADWRSRDRQKGCVSWPSLWPPNVQTTREEVLEELRASDFRPPLR